MTANTVHIAGAGLVGCLAGIFLARKGFTVEIHERRGDMRREPVEAGRSINLAITARGWKALEHAGLKEKILGISIPMKGRMVHDAAGKTDFQPYGQREHEVIYAASRARLNMMLMDEAARHKNLRLNFRRRCQGYDLATGRLEVAPGGALAAGVVIGADGAWSELRRSLLPQMLNVDYSQSFLAYGYKELVIPPKDGSGFRLEPNALHIWARKSYMMIALPNTEGSFTVTLFYPNEGPESFASLTTREAVTAFFAKNFSDAVPLMPGLLDDFFSHPTGSLVTVKCGRWDAAHRGGGSALLIGDAAHAIVPFFAQGMNSGFEDCFVLDQLVTGQNPDWAKVFAEFSLQRKPNADAIADMAVENFIEMRDSVTDPRFLLRKKVGFELEKRWPGRFIPRYSMVTFHPEIPYAEAQRRGAVQDKLLDRLCANISAPDQVDWAEAERLLHQIA
jgi:kynurenine 3-monooxygenase